jgi:hypothetical protein
MEKVINSNEPIKVRVKSPLYDCLSKMNVNEWVNVDCDDDHRAIGNLISAKISIWKMNNKLVGSFSRKVNKEKTIIRITRID